jgi:hypothetical protein
MKSGMLVLALLAVACAPAMQADGSTAAVRQAVETPQRFTTADGIAAEDSCRTTMIDPRDHTSLRLFRSSQEGDSWRGDYEVPYGRYGVRPGELLRLDCITGEVIGIVPQ